jgi:hypothetical protein
MQKNKVKKSACKDDKSYFAKQHQFIGRPKEILIFIRPFLLINQKKNHLIRIFINFM